MANQSKLFVIGASILFAATANSAQSADLYLVGSSGSDNFSDSQHSSGIPISISHSGSDASGSYQSEYFASSGYGVNKVYSFQSTAGSTSASGATSQWTDGIRINTGADSGFMKIGIDIESYLDVSLLSPAFASSMFMYRFSSPGSAYALNYYDRAGTYSFDSTGYIGEIDSSIGATLHKYATILIPFTDNVWFNISSQSTCNSTTVNAHILMPSTATCDSSHSTYWGGILDVTDQSGNSLTDWSITSESGTDYRQSFIPSASGVPEPSTWATMIAGFGLVGFGMRRRNHQQPTVRFAS